MIHETMCLNPWWHTIYIQVLLNVFQYLILWWSLEYKNASTLIFTWSLKSFHFWFMAQTGSENTKIYLSLLVHIFTVGLSEPWTGGENINCFHCRPFQEAKTSIENALRIGGDNICVVVILTQSLDIWDILISLMLKMNEYVCAKRHIFM